MTTSLLTTKLYIPPVRPELVPRPRLVERLSAGLSRKLTLVSAPAGFGKTTLLSEWIKRILEIGDWRLRVAWVSLDEGDNDPARFWAYFVAALQTIEANIGEGVLSAFQASQPPAVDSLLTALINEITAVPDHLVLILDDYHVITAEPIHNTLTFLLDHLPPQMHLMIATRSDPPLQLARLRGRGQLTELRAADLRFTSDQVAKFLNQAMGLELSADDVAALASRTEGWIAGLQMAAVSMQGRRRRQGIHDVSGFVKAITSSHHFILDYLMEEVLDQQTDAIQEFLLKTSVLDRLTAPLCDALMGGQDCLASLPDSWTVLDQLEHANLFLIPLDDERHWYRYHHLFAELLRQRLHQAQPDLVPTLHRRASAWYERNGLMAEAIDHALSAGDFEQAVRLIQQVAEATLMRGQFTTFLGWFEALPDDVVRARPRLCAYHAIVLVMNGRPADEVESRLQDAAEGDTAGLITGELTVLRAVLAMLKGDAQRSIELSHRALALLPEENLFFRSFVVRTLGAVYMLAGDVTVAIRAFDKAVRIAQEAGDHVGAAAALHYLAELHKIQGQLSEARALYQRALEVAVDGPGRLMPVAIKILVGLGELLLQWNDLQAATCRLLEAIELAEKTWVETWGLVGYIHLARVKQAQGDADGAREAIQTAQRFAIEYDATEMDDIIVAAYQARLWVAQGDLESAARWVEERGLVLSKAEGLDGAVGSGGLEEEISSASGSYHVREIEHTTLARVYLAQGRPEEALAVLKPLLGAAERLGRGGSVIEILALQALAFSQIPARGQAQGDTAQALTALERALSLAEPEGYVRLFLDEGEPMARLLRQAASRGIAPEYVSKLLAAFDVSAYGTHPRGESLPHPHTPPFIESLSERELEVLRFLTTHLSSTEIAEELFIAASTVRSHIKSIYAKLDVHSRTDAVQRGKELGLL